ncbi:MAG: HD domain-containing phosphohydrolase [Syntrophales bacterium]|jgi:HD-GYP domain-containing protein (c-di-GMP phosphodiesterase class II)
MVRASDLVKGKTMSLHDHDTKDSSPKAMAPKDALLEEARISFRLSEIDVLKLKKGNQQEINIPTKIGETIVDEIRLTPEPEEEQIAPPSSPPAMAINIRSVRQDEIQVAETSEGLSEEAGLRRVYVATKQYMAHIREQVKNGDSIQLEPALIYINNILNSSEDMVSQIYQLTVDYEQEDDYYLSSPINTMVCGVKIAQRMGYEKSKLIEFGLAALLHDIGMFIIPEQILNKQGRLSDDEMDLIKKHPDLAVEILAPFTATYPKMIKAIYEHQERANGQGYPRGLKGDEICDYAQIIGICDSYEAMTHHRPHKKILLQSDSIKELIGSKTKLFEPRIIKMFLDEISIYPIGSYIRLNNRNIGRVVATSKGNPMKPVVNLIFDEKGKKIEPPRIMDLKNYPVLNIEASISADDLPGN